MKLDAIRFQVDVHRGETIADPSSVVRVTAPVLGLFRVDSKLVAVSISYSTAPSACRAAWRRPRVIEFSLAQNRDGGQDRRCPRRGRTHRA